MHWHSISLSFWIYFPFGQHKHKIYMRTTLNAYHKRQTMYSDADNYWKQQKNNNFYPLTPTTITTSSAEYNQKTIYIDWTLKRVLHTQTVIRHLIQVMICLPVSMITKDNTWEKTRGMLCPAVINLPEACSEDYVTDQVLKTRSYQWTCAVHVFVVLLQFSLVPEGGSSIGAASPRGQAFAWMRRSSSQRSLTKLSVYRWSAFYFLMQLTNGYKGNTLYYVALDILPDNYME